MSKGALILILLFLAGCSNFGENPELFVENRPTPDYVYFIGDSITAGFGMYANGHMVGDFGLTVISCLGQHPLADDRCSNNYGEPFKVEGTVDGHDLVGTSGEDSDTRAEQGSEAKDVAYPYQWLAAMKTISEEDNSLTPLVPDSVKNYAVSGITPSQVNPNGYELEVARCATKSEVECKKNYSWNCAWHKSQDNCVPFNPRTYNAITKEGQLWPLQWKEQTETEKDVKGLAGEILSGFFPGDDGKEEIVPTSYVELNWGLKTLSDNKSKGKSNLVVLTLGADPILASWLDGGAFGHNLRSTNSAASYTVAQNPNYCASSVSNAQACLRQDAERFKLKENLLGLYTELLETSDVLVQLYYRACPGTFANVADANTPGMDTGLPHDGNQLPGKSTPCKAGGKRLAISQAAVDGINEVILAAVKEAQDRPYAKDSAYKIAAICPGYGVDVSNSTFGLSSKDVVGSAPHCSLFDNYQFDGNSSDSSQWVIYADSGAHPNVRGSAALAMGVFYGLCDKLGYFCDFKTSSKTNKIGWSSITALPQNYGTTDPKCKIDPLFPGCAL